jgi:NADH-quinone oxidoreductase subunit J
MTVYALLFYGIAALILVSTAVAVTRRHLVHAVIFLVLSFFGTALLFYLLGAPLLAALEVIIYAGAIMVLFLFLIMMIRTQPTDDRQFPPSRTLPALIFCAAFLAAGMLLATRTPIGRKPLEAAQAPPLVFGTYLFQHHWLTVEIASLLLLAALIGAMVLGRRIRRPQRTGGEPS